MSAPVFSRPLSIGEVFDRAVTLLVRRRRAALVLALLTALPPALGHLLMAYAPTRSGVSVLGLLLVVVGGAMIVYGGAAVLQLTAGSDERPDPLRLLRNVLRDFWRLFWAAVVTNLVTAVTVGIGFAVAAGFAAWLGIVAGAVVGLGLFAAVAPVLFVSELGFAIAVLERVGGIEGMRRAWRRAMHGELRRTYLLAIAVLAAYFGPVFALDGAGTALAALPGLKWVPVLLEFLETATALVFFDAVLAVASLDYRVRAEGLDIEAALDAPSAV